ncbi:hypothetical protein DAPPUDRAFT_256243 [Daphnia pulex]|uniref:Uncharacterized protein n=1 Tax=Daphnia pulex TaxID=6669 RepID=E9HB78_DAPPU|nr:hypothetical protein DAPPUDRAFT_256243 [Daphnia pulex]|eukprot:EFX71057.1 hypothetical protein DAPPUDRAFT_256243 [Daphnia pulex]
MVQTLKASRSSTKGHMTRSIGLINGYAKKVMNQEETNNLEVLELKLKSLYENYQIASRDILEKLRANKATQEELNEEQNINLQTQDEVLGACCDSYHTYDLPVIALPLPFRVVLLVIPAAILRRRSVDQCLSCDIVCTVPRPVTFHVAF